VTRKAYPYTPFDPTVEEGLPIPTRRPALPMDAPYLTFRNHYGTPSETRRGDVGNTRGSLANVVPIEAIFTSGPETVRGDSRNISGGVVKGYIRENTIRMRVLVSRNLFSPTSHARDATRLALSGKYPPPAVVPSKDIGMPPKMGKRGTGGNYVIPAPQVIPSWPTSADWLRGRFR
jgi:hypothetical protein